MLYKSEPDRNRKVRIRSDEEAERRLQEHEERTRGSERSPNRDPERLLRPIQRARESLKLIEYSQKGNSRGLVDILEECPDINVDQVENEMGRSLLAVAVRNDQPEVQWV